MATKRFYGFLREPLSEYAQHDLWRFTHATTTGEVVKGSTSMFKVDEDGYYDIEIQYGTVMIESKDRLSQRWINHGQYTISSATTVTTLPALLLATTPMTPELQQELEAILADTQQARDQTVALFDSVNGDFIYHNKNAVGTVSQAGGIPTGGVMDWGETPNGRFYRYANGQQVCLPPSVFYILTEGSQFIWTFPAPFTSTPQVNTQISSANSTSGFEQLVLKIGGELPTSSNTRAVILYSLAAGADQFNSRLGLFAIGRWY